MNCFLYLPKLKEADARQRLNHRLCPPLPKATFVVRSTGGKNYNREILRSATACWEGKGESTKDLDISSLIPPICSSTLQHCTDLLVFFWTYYPVNTTLNIFNLGSGKQILDQFLKVCGPLPSEAPKYPNSICNNSVIPTDQEPKCMIYMGKNIAHPHQERPTYREVTLWLH